MLEIYGLSNADTSSIYGPYFVVAIVFPSVLEIETGNGVFSPCFAFVGHYVEFYHCHIWQSRHTHR